MHYSPDIQSRQRGRQTFSASSPFLPHALLQVCAPLTRGLYLQYSPTSDLEDTFCVSCKAEPITEELCKRSEVLFTWIETMLLIMRSWICKHAVINCQIGFSESVSGQQKTIHAPMLVSLLKKIIFKNNTFNIRLAYIMRQVFSSLQRVDKLLCFPNTKLALIFNLIRW